MPKRDAKGKIIKKKKGVPDAKSLYPSEHRDALERLFHWFDNKFRPYTVHLQQLIPKAFNSQNKKEQLEDLRKSVDIDMDLIHTSLKVFDKQMAQKKFACGDHITIFDIMFFNELSQVLFLRNKYLKKVDPDANADLDENSELMSYEHINKWYTRTMP